MPAKKASTPSAAPKAAKAPATKKTPAAKKSTASPADDKPAAKKTAAAAAAAVSAPAAEPTKKIAAKKVATKKVATKKAAVAAPVITGQPEGQLLAELCCQYASEKKASNPVILDVRNISSITDFTVILTGTSLPHLRAIRKEIADRLWEEHRVKVYRMDGTPESLWMVADFSDVMVHIFHSETRDKFGLEDLWSDAPRIAFKEKR